MNLVGNRRLIRGGWAHALSAITIMLLAVASVSAATFSVQIAKPGIIPLPAAAAAQAESAAGQTSSQPVPSQVQSATASDFGVRSAIRNFTLVGGGELPNAQELLAKELRSHLYDANFRSEIPERVRDFYQTNGYFKAMVTESSFKQAGPAAVDVAVTVNAGQQYRLEDIRFEGTHVVSESQLRALFPLKSGEVFNTSAIRTGLEAMRRLYLENGQKNAMPSPITKPNDNTGTILLIIMSDRGTLAQDIPDLPGYYKVGDSVTTPRAIYAPDPKYDPAAKAAKSQGVAVYRVGVGSDGLVKDLKFVRSHDDVNGGELMPGLIQNGIDSLRTWRFEPALKDGKAVPVQVNVEVNFRLF